MAWRRKDVTCNSPSQMFSIGKNKVTVSLLSLDRLSVTRNYAEGCWSGPGLVFQNHFLPVSVVSDILAKSGFCSQPPSKAASPTSFWRYFSQRQFASEWETLTHRGEVRKPLKHNEHKWNHSYLQMQKRDWLILDCEISHFYLSTNCFQSSAVVLE